MIMAEDIDEDGGRDLGPRPRATSRWSSIEEGMQKVVYQDPDGNELSFGGTSCGQVVATPCRPNTWRSATRKALHRLGLFR